VVSQRTFLCAGTHDHTKPHLPLLRPAIRIGRGVWVAAEAFVGPGVTVGDNSIVGARAVVASDVPRGVIVVGNPAKVVGARPMSESGGADGADGGGIRGRGK
jgi:putative colanic acid biosynthesis acetyltransferase WcaF